MNVLLILLINALISLFISVIVFIVLTRIFGYGNAPVPQQQAILVPTSANLTPTSGLMTADPDFSAPGSDGETPDVYVVRSGDNLSLIAAQFGLSTEELMLANGIENPDWIGVGQRLVIPRPGEPTATSTVPPIPTITETPLPFDPPTPVATLSPTPTSLVRESGDRSTPSPAAASTTTSSGLVSIDTIRGIGSLPSEEIIIRNQGQLVDLEGWTLSDKDNTVFAFPSIVLWPDATLRIHSGQGNDTPTDLYWNKRSPYGPAKKK